ncbi:MAG: LysR family transcriptional regulator [Bdellovibrionota bacterium]
MDINGHNLPLLASLRTMLDERNITRAAVRLGISQPALSAQLARLRDVFGDQLLTPAASGKGMVLTPRGAELREPLRHALQHLEDVVSKPAVFEAAESDRTFTVGANDNATAIMGSRLIATVRDNGLSQIRLAFRGIDFSRLVDQLETGEIDVALVSKAALPKSLPHQPLLEEEFMMAQRKDHPRGSRRPSLKDYTRLDHVIVSGEGGGFHGFIDDILHEKGLARRVGVSVQYYSVVPLILQTTDLVCTLPARFLSRYQAALTPLRLPFDTRRFSLYATWHARFDNDPGHQWLRRQLAACAAD